MVSKSEKRLEKIDSQARYSRLIKPPVKTERDTPHKPFADYLWKIKFSENVSYDELDQLDKAVIFVIGNVL